MGSLIALLCAARWGNELAGLILTGAALRVMGDHPAAAALGRALARVIPRVPLIPLPPSAISRDRAEARRYAEDSLIAHRPLSLRQSLRLLEAAAARAVLPALRLPVLALHGGADRLSRPTGAALLRERCGSPDCSLIVYPGLRHEIHQEPERAQVLDDMTAWLDRQLFARPAQTPSDAPPGEG